MIKRYLLCELWEINLQSASEKLEAAWINLLRLMVVTDSMQIVAQYIIECFVI